MKRTTLAVSHPCAADAPSPDLYAVPEGRDRPFRVAVVVPQRVPGWISAFLKLAAQSRWLDVTVVATASRKLPSQAVPWDQRAFLAIERARSRRGSASLEPVTLAAWGNGAVGMELAVGDGPDELSARLALLQPDVILVGVGGIPLQGLGDCAENGCWQFHDDLLHPRHAGLSLLGPMLRGEPATSVELELCCPPALPLRLAGSWGRTRPGSFTVQREQAFRKLAPLLLRALHRLATGELRTPRNAIATVRMRSPDSPLGLAAGVRAICTEMSATARLRWKKRRSRNTWILVFRHSPALLDPRTPEWDDGVVLRSPRGFWADPCVVEAAGRHFVFVEEMDRRTGKGTIACVALESAGARRLGLALKEAGHLSFPQVFQWEGSWYLTVESSEERRVSLYRAIAFPLEWERVRDLVSERVCVDPVLHFHEGRWYLFANVAENGNSTWDELFLFVAEDLSDPFRPHPCNPIVSDVRRARLAGRLFHRAGMLIRPAQDCVPNYGSAVVFNEIVQLDPLHYSERVLSRLAPPGWVGSVDGCHTFSAAGGIEVVDVRGIPAPGVPALHLDHGFEALARAASPAQCATST